MESLERIVVPVDFSPFSKNALRAALVLARATDASLTLLHVIAEYEAHAAFNIPLPGEELEPQARAWAERAYDDYLRGEETKGVDIDRQVRFGIAAKSICDFAEETGADMIVIASHGRSGFERAMFGSVAEKVVRSCPRPVLIIKGPKPT